MRHRLAFHVGITRPFGWVGGSLASAKVFGAARVVWGGQTQRRGAGFRKKIRRWMHPRWRAFEADEPVLLDLRITGKDCCSCPKVRGVEPDRQNGLKNVGGFGG